MFNLIYQYPIVFKMTFPPIFKNGFVSGDDIGEYMKTYAEKHGLLQHSSKMMTSSFHSENGSVITPLFNFYLNLGLQCTKTHRFVVTSHRNVSMDLSNQLSRPGDLLSKQEDHSDCRDYEIVE